MDFRNLCQKLDVDSLRAKLPPLPGLPALPQIKLPKSIPKLKSRKIFRSSRENVNRNSPENRNQFQQKQCLDIQVVQHLPPIPPANFIKQTPTRISTISSLMLDDSGEESTYRSAGSIDDDYAQPSYQRHSSSAMLPQSPATIGPLDTRAGHSQARMSLTERLHRSYKDLTEFRLKHIFAKKTVVRKDSIRVQHYVTHYEEDRVREAQEQARRDSAIAENYTFRFKVSRQNTDQSNSVSPDDSPRSEPPTMGRSTGRTLSGDESGMEATPPPPPRKPGIAATRFAKVRNPPLRQSSSEQQSEEREEEQTYRPEPNDSSLWAMQKKKKKQQQQQTIQSQSMSDNETKTTTKKLSYKQRMRQLTGYLSAQDDSDGPEAQRKGSSRTTKVLSKAERESKQKSKNSPRSSDEEQQRTAEPQDTGSPTSRAFRNFRHNFKRLQQSFKARSQQNVATDESADESTAAAGSAPKSNIASKAEKFTTRLRKFRSRDVSVDDLNADEQGDPKQSASTQSPIRQTITNKLESWKKSFKRKSNKPDDEPATDGETSPEKEKTHQKKRSDTLIRKLKHIRTRKSSRSKDELDATNTDGEAIDGEGTQKTKSRTVKFNEARQRTFKKVNEKMHQMKFFQKSPNQPGTHATANESPPQKKKYQSEEEDDDGESESEEVWNETHQHEEATINLPPAITRRDFPPPHECSSEGESFDQVAVRASHSTTINIPAARAAWTSRSLLSQSMESDIDPSELPRVLIHQDNSDSFESTLIIAVTRPIVSAGPGPIITEITSTTKGEQPKQKDWVTNKKIIADFVEAPPPRNGRKQSVEAMPSLSGHKRKLSMDSSSNSDSDSWMQEHKGGTTSRCGSLSGLVSIDEKSEAWKVRTPSVSASKGDNQPLYKTKSIDIFEKNVLRGGVLTAFEDFDEELRDEPVQKIITIRNSNSCDRESSEDTADDDNSSRITKISVNQLKQESGAELDNVDHIKEESKDHECKRKLLQYGNSRESLTANFDENEENSSSGCEEDGEDDDEDNDDDDDDDDDDDRPPSVAPSPPPRTSPPPPPLPQRQPSVRGLVRKPSETPPPPLPKSKPPPLPPSMHQKQALPPRIPERTTSIPRAPKPLVKTSSLRLVFSEQVRPSDVGKVNKLISKFEPMEGNALQRPRVIPRRIPQDDSDEYSDDEEDYAAMAVKLKERYANVKIERDTTPTPTNTPSQSTPELKTSPPDPVPVTVPTDIRMRREFIVPMVVTTTDEDNNVQILSQPHEMRPIDLAIDTNSNKSRANSEYGSPMEYPSSLRGSLETIPTLERREATGPRLRSVDRQHYARSRRSMTRDDENFYSFDSDEENSYYSISSTGSNRYIVEL